MLVRHLAPLLRNKTVRNVQVRRVKVLAPTSSRKFARTLRGARFVGLSRRGKYLVFEFRAQNQTRTQILVGHLGMTGRMYLLPAAARLPRHAAVVLGLGREKFIFEDTRYFGRLTLDASVLARLGPEPLAREFTAACFARALSRSTQPIKIKLLDQSLVAGVGNIYASEALFRARLAPTLPACRLSNDQVDRLRRAIREVLREAIDCGSTVPFELFRRGQIRQVVLFRAGAGLPGFLRGTVAGLRSRGAALCQLRQPHKGHVTGCPPHILLFLLPAPTWGADRKKIRSKIGLTLEGTTCRLRLLWRAEQRNGSILILPGLECRVSVWIWVPE